MKKEKSNEKKVSLGKVIVAVFNTAGKTNEFGNDDRKSGSFCPACIDKPPYTTITEII